MIVSWSCNGHAPSCKYIVLYPNHKKSLTQLAVKHISRIIVRSTKENASCHIWNCSLMVCLQNRCAYPQSHIQHDVFTWAVKVPRCSTYQNCDIELLAGNPKAKSVAWRSTAQSYGLQDVFASGLRPARTSSLFKSSNRTRGSVVLNCSQRIKRPNLSQFRFWK